MSESYSSLDVDIIDWDAKAEKCIGRRFGPISCEGIQFLGSDRYINERRSTLDVAVRQKYWEALRALGQSEAERRGEEVRVQTIRTVSISS